MSMTKKSGLKLNWQKFGVTEIYLRDKLSTAGIQSDLKKKSDL